LRARDCAPVLPWLARRTYHLRGSSQRGQLLATDACSMRRNAWGLARGQALPQHGLAVGGAQV